MARQEGFVPGAALILMVVATILAMTAMGTNTLEEKMSGYMRDRQVAMQAAEAALRDGERDVQKQLVGISEADFVSGCNTSATTIPSGRDLKGLCAVEIDGSPIWIDLESTTRACKRRASGARSLDNRQRCRVDRALHSLRRQDRRSRVRDIRFGSTAVKPARQPRYIVEAVPFLSGARKTGFGPAPPNFVYRVTAVGFARRKRPGSFSRLSCGSP
ncbi:MAG: PilX N-terminal domain-containing pilus assembly protein [Chromatiales bacterium]|nr:PilX N-terminal domain-containing pilus assembly protein [Chromatiales bacterium]